jgi:hypothetical protein
MAVDDEEDEGSIGSMDRFSGIGKKEFDLRFEGILVQTRELVLGRFWESIHKDLILLVIFAGEREDSIQIQRIDSELVTIPLPKSAKKKALTNFVLE